MAKEFRIEHEAALPATQEQAWIAVTRDMGAWLMPSEPTSDTAIVWEPPRRCVSREQDGDWFNQLEFSIEERGTGSFIRYVHFGIFVGDWDDQYEGARRHTVFYMHTLGQYLAHFQGLAYRHVEVNAPPSSLGADGLVPVRRALGIEGAVDISAVLDVTLPGVGATRAVLDYADDAFLGLRTNDALYRFFGRNHFGLPVAVGAYQYGEQATPIEAVGSAWTRWLDDVYGG